jgi:hypothetical protein
MKYLSAFFLTAFLTGCGGGSDSSTNYSSSASSNDASLLGLWKSTSQVILLGENECTTSSGQTEYFYTIEFRANDYDISRNVCQLIPIANTPTYLLIEGVEAGEGVNYKTGGTGFFAVYENGVLTKDFKDIDILNSSGTFYSVYWTDGASLEFAGIPPDCGSGTTGEYSNDRCIPSANTETFIKQ